MLQDSFKTKNGINIRITFIKHASLLIEIGTTENSADKTLYVIAVDPVSEYADYSSFTRADMVLVTHEHYDHCDFKAIQACSQALTTFVCNSVVAENISKQCSKNDNLSIKNLQNGESASLQFDKPSSEPSKNNISKLTITALPAYNTSPDRQKFHPHNGRDNGYLLELDDFKIYIAGDTEDIPEMATLKNKNIDIAFLPVNQPYTMTPEQALNAAKAIHPRVLYPYHYGDTAFNNDFFKTLEQKGIEVRMRDME